MNLKAIKTIRVVSLVLIVVGFIFSSIFVFTPVTPSFIFNRIKEQLQNYFIPIAIAFAFFIILVGLSIKIISQVSTYKRLKQKRDTKERADIKQLKFGIHR